MYEWNVVQLNIYISQGSAATEFMCGGKFYQFIYESKSERIIEIGPHLPKLS